MTGGVYVGKVGDNVLVNLFYTGDLEFPSIITCQKTIEKILVLCWESACFIGLCDVGS